MESPEVKVIIGLKVGANKDPGLKAIFDKLKTELDKLALAAAPLVNGVVLPTIELMKEKEMRKFAQKYPKYQEDIEALEAKLTDWFFQNDILRHEFPLNILGV